MQWKVWTASFLTLCALFLTVVLIQAASSDPDTWPIVYQDDFENPESGWGVGEDESVRLAYVDGAYEIQVKDDRWIAWSRIPGNREFLDFTVEVKVQVVAGAGEFGLLLRHDDSDNFYCFTFRTGGHYCLRMQKNDSWQTLVDWTPWTAFESGVANHLQVIAQGETLSFLLNGEFLTEVTDDTLRAGQIALCTGTFEERGVTVRFDEIAVQEDLEVRATAERAQTLFAEGSQLYQAWDILGARAAFREALGLFEELSWREKEAEASLSLGNCWYLLNDYRHAIEHYERSLSLYREIGDRDGESTSLNNLGSCYRSLGDYSKAIEYYQASVEINREIGDIGNVGRSLEGVGDCFSYLGHYDKAIEFYEVSLRIAREIGDCGGEARSFYSLGNSYYSLGDYSKAIEYYQASFEINHVIGDKEGVAGSLNNLGHCYVSLGDYNKVIECYETSSAIFREIGNRNDEAATLNDFGDYYSDLGDYEKAIDYYESSLAIFREIGARGGEAASLGNLGSCYQSLGSYGKAIDYYETALAAFQEIGTRADEAECLNSLGDCYSDLGDYPEAIEHSEQGLAIFREIGARGGEASSLNNLGDCYSDLGDYEKAITYLEQALAIHREIGARDGERASLGCLGACYLQWAQYRQAIDYAEQALAIAREIGARAGEAGCLGLLGRCYTQLGQHQRAIEYQNQALIIAQGIGARSVEAICLDVLGEAYQKLGNYQEAISLHTKALAIAQEIGTRPLEAAALDNLGNCYRERGDYSEAFDYFTRSQTIAQEIGMRPDQAEGLKDLGLCYEALENFTQAIDCYTRSLVIAQEIGLAETAWKAQRGLGWAHWKIGKLDLAREEYEQAIAAVEAISGRIQVKGLLGSYLVSVRQLYQEYFELLLDMGQEEETLVVSERSRARTFLDLLAQSSERTLEYLVTRGIAGAVDAGAIEQDIQKMVATLPKKTATLEYYVTNEATHVWVITERLSHGPYEIPHGREELMTKVIECRRFLEQLDQMANWNLTLLYEWLIRPIEDLLPQSTEEDVPHLVIVPSGPLYYLPFQALIWTSADRSEHAYLAERYAISYSPSLTMVKYVQSLDQRSDKTPTFIGVADPDAGEAVPRIPEAGTEAYRISVFFPVADVYVGRDANEDVVRTECGEAQLFLVAAHGKFNPENPMYSYLALTPTQDNDGKLHAYEVFDLALKADMVVLSACETLLPALKDMEEQIEAVQGMPGSGKGALGVAQLIALTGGDDVVGLTRAFLVAGACSVLSSLWKVDSKATADLMIAFHRYLEEGMDKAHALRAAQLDVLNSPDIFPSPLFWAAFNLMGDWR